MRKNKKKNPKMKKAVIPAALNVSSVDLPAPREELHWQGALRLIRDRAFKILTPKGHGTGFHIGTFGLQNQLCAIATARHVVDSVHQWGEPIKIVHDLSGEVILLKEADRAIFTYPNLDLAILVFSTPANFALPNTLIDRIPNGSCLNSGVEVAWYGFPAIQSDKLCFFHGYVSCYLDKGGDYLIDGVAINGVSGGPVFYIDNITNSPKIAGVITAYIANRATGDTLPGLSMITSISPFEETIRSLSNLSEAKKEAEEMIVSDPAKDDNPDKNE